MILKANDRQKLTGQETRIAIEFLVIIKKGCIILIIIYVLIAVR